MIAVIAVFATNCINFVLQQDGVNDFIVERHNVHYINTGLLKDEIYLPNKFLENLRKNVKVRFVFYQRASKKIWMPQTLAHIINGFSLFPLHN